MFENEHVIWYYKRTRLSVAELDTYSTYVYVQSMGCQIVFINKEATCIPYLLELFLSSNTACRTIAWCVSSESLNLLLCEDGPLATKITQGKGIYIYHKNCQLMFQKLAFPKNTIFTDLKLCFSNIITKMRMSNSCP